jgi:flagellar M-ring protein FliF
VFEFLRQLGLGVRDAWSRLSLNARVQIGLAGFLTLLILGGSVYFGAQPQYALLYNRLDPAESGLIQTWLQEQGIPYQSHNGGGTINVPAKDISRAKVQLANINLPTSHGVAPGFEMFDNPQLMTNQYLQDVDYMRAVNGELQRMLNDFTFVKSSKVFINKSAPQLFSSVKEPSEATVILDVKEWPLSNMQKKAVLNTVSHFGGARLSRNNIVITTTDGDKIHSPSSDEFASMASDKFEHQVMLETQRELKIDNYFLQLNKRAIVSVSAVMDWTTTSRKETTFGDGVVTSEELNETTSTTTNGLPEGAPGASANIPGDLAVESVTTVNLEDSSTISNLEIPKSETLTGDEGGKVSKFVVSVVIEGNYVPLEGGADGETEYVALTDEEILDYETFIRDAVGEGVTETTVTIFDQEFGKPLDVMPVSAGLPGGGLVQNPFVRFAVQILLIILGFFAVRTLMGRAMVLPTTETEETIELPEASADEKRQQEVMAEVERLTAERPETVASLLRSWMNEDDVF